MADASIIDIGGTQWNIKDKQARNRIEEVVAENSKIIDVALGGTFNFSAKMKYLGEDETYKYYNFWWEPQIKSRTDKLITIVVLPPNTTTDKILSLNLNILQEENAGIEQRTQHQAGINQSGMVTYIFNVSANPRWTISGMGILRRTK